MTFRRFVTHAILPILLTLLMFLFGPAVAAYLVLTIRERRARP